MRALRTTVGSSVIFTLLTIAALILAIILFSRQYKHVIDVLCSASCEEERVLNSTCDTGVACRMAYYLPQLGVCRDLAAVADTACQTICLIDNATNSFCSTTGTCIPGPGECRGDCTDQEDPAFCNTSMPLNLNWFGVNDTEVNVPIFWNYVYQCYLDSCRLFTLTLFWHSFQTGVLVSGAVPCIDLLDPAFIAARGRECLIITQFVFDPNLTQSVHYLNDSTTNQFAICTFSYACAPIVPPPPILKRTTTTTDDFPIVRSIGANADPEEVAHMKTMGMRLLKTSPHYHTSSTRVSVK